LFSGCVGVRLDKDYPWVSRELRDFRVNVPNTFNWGFDVVDRRAREADKLALLYTDDGGRTEHYSFSQISSWSNRLANMLSQYGLSRGDPVLVMLGNTPILWALMVALFKMGAIVVPCSTQLTKNDVDYRIRACGAKAAVTTPENKAKFEGGLGDKLVFRGLCGELDRGAGPWVPVGRAEAESEKPLSVTRTSSSDPAMIYFTSGTEGPPKMVVHTHTSYPLGHLATALWLGLREHYLHWNISSPGWAKHAWSSVFAPWGVGAAVFVYNYGGRFSAAGHLEKLCEFKVDSLCAAPTIWRMFLLEDLSRYDFSSLKEVASAGEPLNPEVIERFKRATGLTIRDGYGQTETVVQVANFPGVPVKSGSMGVPCPLYDVDIVDEEGKVLGPSVEGNIAIRIAPEKPFALLKEYAADPERNSEAFRSGWYYTGDRGYKDPDGYFWFVGRADDVIKSSGYRIGPFEVESALIKHPSVAEAAVVAAPDQLRGAAVKAYVVLKPNWTPSQELADELASHVARETAPYKHPRKIEFVASLDPVKTISGKIRRSALRHQEHGAQRIVSGQEFTVGSIRG
jgi:acyl-coenzyme A synthetase/AMP-(fatty) acid ligase